MLDIKSLLPKIAAIRAEIQNAITASEHIFTSEKGDIETGQLPTATGALQTAITNLEGHLAKAAEIEAANKKVEAD